jgi:hypothetical protein
VTEPVARPRTQPSIAFDLIRTDGSGQAATVGRATFQAGRSAVEAPEAISVAVGELLGRAFVDRVQADERPRGYRRTRRGQVDMLVPGMAEHFIARLRGLWLPYPDGSVVTAREVAADPQAAATPIPELAEAESPVTDPAIRRATLAEAAVVVNARPLARENEPATGLRPTRTGAARTDCGWIV